MTTAAISGAPMPVRAAYTEALVRRRVHADLEFCGITRQEIAVTRCDDLLNVYAARVRVHLGPTHEHPVVNTVYLFWRDRSGKERFRTIIHPRDVGNENIDVIFVQTDGHEIVISCREHCGLGALKSSEFERRFRIAELDL